MNSYLVRRSNLVLSGFAGLTLLVACEDKRVQNLDTGITRDSALTVLAQDMRKGGGPDSFPNIYHRDRYIIDGKNYEVLYYNPNNEKLPPNAKDTAWAKTTPVVFVENKVIGRGWDFWDSVSKAKNIPLRKRDSK